MSDTRPRAAPAVRWLSPLAVGLGTALLAAGYVVDGPDPWVAFVAPVPALVWIVGRTHRSGPAVDGSLAAFVALAGLGLWLGVDAVWMVSATVAGLGAWDLAHLERRLAEAGHVEDRALLEARHLAYLVPVLALGLALALVATGVRLDLGFFPALLLGVLAFAGLAWTVAYLRRDE